jgi:branched-chain amino acid transport system ATP-binding protein
MNAEWHSSPFAKAMVRLPMSLLRCENLAKSFDGILALDDLTLTLPSRGIVSLIGPNGAGKTTLLNIFTGFLRPDAGRVLLEEVELTGRPPHWIVRSGVARTFQDLRLVRLISVLDNVMLARQAQKGERLWRALTRLGVRFEEQSNRCRAMDLLEFVGLAAEAGRPAGSLSHGQQKLLTLACCLATDARILMLDEPVAGVDPNRAGGILSLLQELRDDGRLIVFIEHDIQAVREVAERVIVMDHGRIIADGSPGDVLECSEILEAYIG